MPPFLHHFPGLRCLCACVLAAAACTAGAQTAVEKISYDAAAHAELKKLVLLRPSTPSVMVERMGGIVVSKAGENPDPMIAGALFGPVAAGMAASANKTQPNSRELAAKLKALGFDFNERYTAQVKAALEKAGYEVRLADAERSYKVKFAANLAGVAQPGEAVLDLGMTIPMIIAGNEDGARYVTLARFTVRLALPEGKPLIYQNDFAYAPASRSPTATHIALDPKYTYESYEAVLAGDKTVAEGFDAGITAVAAKIAEDLKRKTE
jgi:hypothetical protein